MALRYFGGRIYERADSFATRQDALASARKWRVKGYLARVAWEDVSYEPWYVWRSVNKAR